MAGRKYVKKDNEPPLRLLDDLFRKTKTTPCIYWLPLTPEQVNIEIKMELLESELFVRSITSLLLVFPSRFDDTISFNVNLQ